MEGNRDDTTRAQNHAFIVDENHRLVYLNSVAENIFPSAHLGDACYAAFRDGTHVCPDCPWENRSSETDLSTQGILYNHLLDRWLTVTCTRIEWADHNSCVLYTGKTIDENNKNLLRAFCQPETYDELFELNPTSQTYRILYYDKDKYVMPALSGGFPKMVNEFADVLVHPDDRERFLEFWKPNNVSEACRQQGRVKNEFRKKLRQGGYRWVCQTITPISRGERDEEVLFCFISDIDEQKKKSLNLRDAAGILATHSTEDDPLTGLSTNFVFYDKVDACLKEHPTESFDLLYLDIEHFRILNEWYGRAEGDRLLKAFGGHLANLRDVHQGVAGYLGGDDFVLLLPHRAVTQDLLDGLLNFPTTIIRESIGFLLAIGICKIEDRSISAATLCDHAATALSSIKGNYTTRVARYDSAMTQRLEQEPKIILEVQRGLKGQEFILYWQPKCNITTRKIVGLEALVRWQHPERGLILPGEFIPLLEKSGFIASLDLFVWEEVCRALRSWINEGHRPIPVSINISRADMYSVDVPETLENLIHTYQIDRSLLELEITESAYVEDLRMADVAAQLQDLGFTILMDDFGSGYSSLNMLKDIKVDILKIDMGFLKLSEDTTERGESIIKSVISMARLMELTVVAEGVETQEQVDFLSSLGCAYVQGYYFFRPLSGADTRKLLLDDTVIDYGGMRKSPVGQIRLTNLVQNNTESQTMLDNLLGGMAIYELCDGRFELLQVNERYCRITEYEMNNLEQHRHSVGNMVHPDDLDFFMGLFAQAESNKTDGADGTIRRYRLSGNIMWIHFRVFFLREQNERKIFYATLTDVTEQKEQEAALAASQEALNEILGFSSIDRKTITITEDNQRVAARLFAQSAPSGLIGGYCEKESSPPFFASNEMLRMLGYSSYDDLVLGIHNNLENIVHPDDYARVLDDIGPDYHEGLDYTSQYRMLRKDGSSLWVVNRGRIVQAQDGRLATTNSCVDVTETVLLQQKLVLEDDLLRSVIQQADLNIWVYDVETHNVTFQNIAQTSILPAFLDTLPRSNENALGESIIINDFSTRITNSPFFSPDDKQTLLGIEKRIQQGESSEEEIQLQKSSSEKCFWLKITWQTVLDAQQMPLRAIGYLEDITDEKKQELDLLNRAERDSLTGLLNRQTATDLISAEFNEGITEDTPAAFLIFDFDKFKQVNDTYGHPYGDKILTKCGHFLKKYFRKKDILCRWGGDEFIVLCKEVSPQDIERKVQDMCDASRGSDLIFNRKINLSLSAGIVLLPTQATDFDTAYARADIALHEAKSRGEATYTIYTPDMHPVAQPEQNTPDGLGV
ncbi:MAG: EAL domain-containing protein [Raoultibacter sp.]